MLQHLLVADIENVRRLARWLGVKPSGQTGDERVDLAVPCARVDVYRSIEDEEQRARWREEVDGPRMMGLE